MDFKLLLYFSCGIFTMWQQKFLLKLWKKVAKLLKHKIEEKALGSISESSFILGPILLF
jgi:hypothetical protein